jgi:ribonucleoside-triphosphate reductase
MGGQAIPAFDFYLAPYVRKTFIEELNKLQDITKHSLSHLYDSEIDDYLKKDTTMLEGDELYKQYAINATVERVHQSMEAFVHNAEMIHSRGGNQVVFCSINYGTDTSSEGRCIIREILNTTYDGVGVNGQTAIFPIQVWKKKRGVSYLPTDKNYDLYELACKVSAKRFFPNFVNLDATFNQHELWREDNPKRYEHEIATMGCRTRVWENRFGDKTSIGRGNLSFTTVNIVRLAIESAIESGLLFKKKGGRKFESIHNNDMTEKFRKDIYENCEKLFFEKLDKVLILAATQLDERYNFQKKALKKQFPLLMSGMWNGSEKLTSDETIESVINQGTLGIGFIGLAEALIALTGKHHGESDYSQKLGLKIVSHMRDKANEFSEKYKHNYSVLATPAEGLSGKFTKVDKEKFGVIEGVTDKEYYTNSNHIPVYYKCTPSHKAEIEGPYHDLTRGGHIFYVEMDGDATHNPEAIMTIVDIMDKYNIGYCSVNHNRNRCLDCGYENSEKELKICPKCGGENIDTLQRITGYLVGTTSRWNSAKLSELKDRVTHN